MTWLSFNPEPDTALLRYGYSSMTTPSSVFQIDLDSGERTLLKQQEVKTSIRAHTAANDYGFLLMMGSGTSFHRLSSGYV